MSGHKYNSKAIKIPSVIYTDLFLKFVAVYAEDFKKHKGYGKYWLKEHQRMDANGWFQPKKLRELYIKILDGSNTLFYVYKEAINTICTQALNTAIDYTNTFTYDVRIITGEIAVNDNDEELIGLSLSEALDICKAMNEEAEELLFNVYNSDTGMIIK